MLDPRKWGTRPPAKIGWHFGLSACRNGASQPTKWRKLVGMRPRRPNISRKKQFATIRQWCLRTVAVIATSRCKISLPWILHTHMVSYQAETDSFFRILLQTDSDQVLYFITKFGIEFVLYIFDFLKHKEIAMLFEW